VLLKVSVGSFTVRDLEQHLVFSPAKPAPKQGEASPALLKIIVKIPELKVHESIFNSARGKVFVGKVGK
jgi:hypothetical protein